MQIAQLKKYDAIFVSNLFSEEVAETAMNSENRVAEGLRFWEGLDILGIKIAILLTESKPDVTQSRNFKLGIKGLQSLAKINNEFLGNKPLGFGASMKRLALRNVSAYGSSNLTIGDNLTALTVIKLIMARYSANVDDSQFNFFMTGPTGLVGNAVLNWLLINTKWKIYAKTLNIKRAIALLGDTSGRVMLFDDFSYIDGLPKEVLFDSGLLATHLSQSIPVSSVLSRFDPKGCLFDESLPLALDENAINKLPCDYVYELSNGSEDCNYEHGRNIEGGMDNGLTWPCVAELSVLAHESFNGFDKHAFLEVTPKKNGYNGKSCG